MQLTTQEVDINQIISSNNYKISPAAQGSKKRCRVLREVFELIGELTKTAKPRSGGQGGAIQVKEGKEEGSRQRNPALQMERAWELGRRKKVSMAGAEGAPVWVV